LRERGESDDKAAAERRPEQGEERFLQFGDATQPDDFVHQLRTGDLVIADDLLLVPVEIFEPGVALGVL